MSQMPGSKVKVIRPKAAHLELGLGEIWEYRELLYFFTWKQIKTKYKQTAIGVGWAVIQPLLTTIIFAIIFYNIAGLSTGGVPPIPFLFAGLMLWTFFSTTFNGASMSLVLNYNMVSKIYFPRILLPLSLVVAGLLDYLIAWLLFVVIVMSFGASFSLLVVLSLIPLTLMFLVGAGMSFFMSALSAKYRDVQYIVPFVLQILLYGSPVLYPTTWVTNNVIYTIMVLNPLSGIMNSQRFFIFGVNGLDVTMFISSIFLSVLVFFVGLIYFKAYERKFADVI